MMYYILIDSNIDFEIKNPHKHSRILPLLFKYHLNNSNVNTFWLFIFTWKTLLTLLTL